MGEPGAGHCLDNLAHMTFLQSSSFFVYLIFAMLSICAIFASRKDLPAKTPAAHPAVGVLENGRISYFSKFKFPFEIDSNVSHSSSIFCDVNDLYVRQKVSLSLKVTDQTASTTLLKGPEATGSVRSFAKARGLNGSPRTSQQQPAYLPVSQTMFQ